MIELAKQSVPQGPALTADADWQGVDGQITLLQGDALERMQQMPEGSFDLIFADPPYFLSNGGSTCRSGKRASVNKGDWDQCRGAAENHAFNKAWLAACQRLLSKNGTIWVSGTSHVIYSVGYAMQELGYKLLNDIIWEKPNPPPNLSCRYFTHSTETVIWAARDRSAKHHFEYAKMRAENGGKQMKNVWRFTAPAKREKTQGKHPTQKPLALLERILASSAPEGARILDPFNGSGTTGIACMRAGLEYVGIEKDPEYLDLSRRRIEEELQQRAMAEALPAPKNPRRVSPAKKSSRKRSAAIAS